MVPGAALAAGLGGQAGGVAAQLLAQWMALIRKLLDPAIQ